MRHITPETRTAILEWAERGMANHRNFLVTRVIPGYTLCIERVFPGVAATEFCRYNVYVRQDSTDPKDTDAYVQIEKRHVVTWQDALEFGLLAIDWHKEASNA